MKNFEQESPIEKLLRETVEKMDLAETHEKLAGCEANIQSAQRNKETLEEELENIGREKTISGDPESIKNQISLQENIIRDEGEMRNLLEEHLHQLEKAA